ncbi:tetratricopeptide repeat protein [Marinigracilibium pacificum]|uniref:Tetratricopeptide repeat protein n=1 Tax=Marinigracilibium pacificum TaxID=2729599 RepID=A0A848IZB9_9BACT|nr:tetratricopeptide repeat protein [Marinigracilibium pacificum]NMM49883.1 tetratricopeptide repeat protein [Marinigracilibium pacificum]
MKKVIFLISFALIASLGVAQKKNVRKAESELQSGNLSEAKTLIDQAITDEKSKEDGQTWFVRGEVYMAIAKAENGAASPAFQTALDSYNKVFEIEKEGSPTYFVTQQKVQGIYGDYINKGIKNFESNNYDSAYYNFSTAELVNPGDTLALLYSGYAAQNSQQFDKALESYTGLIATGHAQPDVYIYAANINMTNNEDNEAAMAVINKGLEKYPENLDLLKTQIDVYKKMGKTEEAKQSLIKAIEKEPDNYILHYVLGDIYDKEGSKAEAIAAYEKAVEVNPEFVEGYYNAGVLHYNDAVAMLNEANKMDIKTYQKEGAKVEAQAKTEFEKAAPYFEKVLELNPDELTTLETLKTIYVRTGENDKAEKIQSKIDSLQ